MEEETSGKAKADESEEVPAPDPTSALRMEEFRAARREIEANIADIRLAIRYALIGTGAVWAWVATHEHISSYAMFLPLGIIFPGLIQTIQLMHETGVKGQFIYQIERSTGLRDGWEHFLDAQKSKRFRPSPYMTTWLMMILVVVIVGFAYRSLRANSLHPPDEKLTTCCCSMKPEV